MAEFDHFRRDWNAKEYLSEFYSGNKISTSEVTSLKYLVDILKSEGRIFSRAIDVGSGPTLHQIIPLIPYVNELHLSDFLPQNLVEIKKWLENDPDSHNWDMYINHVLELEGNNEAGDTRKVKMRKVITRLLPVDISATQPLGVEVTYPLVTSFYCADSVTEDKGEWRRYLKNIFNLLEPGGLIILEALRNSDSYDVATKKFPSPHINENDFMDLLVECEQFIDASIDVQVMANPEWKVAGFDAMIRAKARKRT